MMRAAIFLLAAPLAYAGPTCESLATFAIPHTMIVTAELRPAGDFSPPGAAAVKNLPSFCRVAGSIKPSDDSDIGFEVWLPTTGWNGKFQGIGNGGFAGSINFGGLADALRHNYASASTDTGHRAGGTDAGWALHHYEKIVDFGYRAIHETAVVAKLVMKQFYGADPRWSYFNSCSNGGRQALMEAQRYPADYNGIVAGAPANFWTHLMANAVWNMQATLDKPENYIPAAKLPAIQAAALAACDTIDRVKDGVIEDPRQCRFDVSALLCKEADSNTCLTVPQVAALQKLYAGSRNSKGTVFPGYSPGGEADPAGWQPWITGPAPEKSAMYAFGTQFFIDMVFDDPNWQFRSFNPDRDLKVVDDKAAKIVNSDDPDLSAFQKRGGKLIVYHGWSDAAIAPQNAINYVESVDAKMGASNAEGFLRLYMVPGMQHCGGGAGVTSFGAGGPPYADRFHDLDAALEAWVEQGQAPSEIIATKYKNASDPSAGVLRTRPLCPYPTVGSWKGTGSTDDAANFTCVKPAK
ncbi:MAG: tannase/feruloyl esterase family alpha/beta hydrolase [Ignavibacteriota bacterium]